MPRGAARDEDTPISVEEATQLYPDRWVLMEVTEYDEYRSPAQGIVRLASKSHRRIVDKSLQIRDAMRETGEFRTLFIYYTETDELRTLESVLAAARWEETNRAGRAGPSR
jgi:hypothetical protein